MLRDIFLLGDSFIQRCKESTQVSEIKRQSFAKVRGKGKKLY
jgi:hypothetical protein